MDLMEYQAKSLFNDGGIPTPQSCVLHHLENLSDVSVPFPVVVKAQVPVGGRGKAGGIGFAENQAELAVQCQRILGMDIKGHIASTLLIAQKCSVQQEWYLAIMLDRLSKCPLMIFSVAGGMDIEEVARTTPDKVCRVPINPTLGIQDYTIRYVLSRSNLSDDFFAPLFDLSQKLYQVFCQNDCLLTEINPLGVVDGKLMALDGKVSVDDSALYRQPHVLAFRSSVQEDPLVLQARDIHFLYIPCDPNGKIAVMSNGSGMIMSCIDLLSKKGLTVGAALDLGGGATADRIAKGVSLLLNNPQISALFISIFGGITRCDEVAMGVKTAVEALQEPKTCVLRVEGTNKDEGKQIIASISGRVISVDNIAQGVIALAEEGLAL